MGWRRSNQEDGSRPAQRRWDGAVALVTGASSGIGAATTRRLVAEGARVGMVARSRPALEELAAELPEGRSVVASADVTDRRSLEGAVSAVTEALGDIDLLVNNAGVGLFGPFLEVSESDVRRLLDVNVIGAVNVLQAVVPAMVQRRRGVVVNVASIAGRIGAPWEAIYSATKFALVGLSESLVAELAGTGVELHLVDPGPVDTDFFRRRGAPYGRSRPRPVAAEAVADRIVSARGRAGSEVFVPRWLGPAHKVKTMFPPLYRASTRFDVRRTGPPDKTQAPSDGS